MSDTEFPASPPDPKSDSHSPEPEADAESFDAMLSAFEKSHSHRPAGGEGQTIGTVLAVAGERIFLDLGLKIEGVLPLAALPAGATATPGESFPILIKGRTEDGYYDVSILRVKQPTDWASLERAFAEKSIISGAVTAAVKGGLTVDIGVRAFLPASRSGTRDAVEMEKLIGQEIRCRILKVDAEEEDVVVDRRSVLEAEQRAAGERIFAGMREGDTVSGVVRSLTSYGAFVDLGGMDGLVHVGDMAWHRVSQPSDALAIGQQITAKVLKVDAGKRRISLGIKQLQPDPWDNAPGKYSLGERVRGTVTRVADFGAFVELEPGVEGLIHLSEMSWTRKTRKPGDIVKTGETVDAVVLSINSAERRIGLGLKQALGDPWANIAERFAVGSTVEGPVTGFTTFGAFVQLAEGVEGMIHISEIGAERRLQHPREALHTGQVVKAQVLEIDPAKRQMRLSMKKLVPVSLDEYLADHKPGDSVTGRVAEIDGGSARVELCEGIVGRCPILSGPAAKEASASQAKADLGQLSSMLQARWKGGATRASAETREALRPGQIRSFRIVRADAGAKTIDLELA